MKRYISPMAGIMIELETVLEMYFAEGNKMAGRKRLYKVRDGKICGVCGGIAKYFGIDPTLVRIIWAILAFAWGTAVILYFILAFILEDAPEGYYEQDMREDHADYIDVKYKTVDYKDVNRKMNTNKEDYVDVDYRPVEEVSDEPIGFDPSKYNSNNY